MLVIDKIYIYVFIIHLGTTASMAGCFVKQDQVCVGRRLGIIIHSMK